MGSGSNGGQLRFGGPDRRGSDADPGSRLARSPEGHRSYHRGMAPSSRARLRTPFVVLWLGVVAVLVVAACSAPAFDPTGPCTTDGKVAGAYPDLEKLVPTSYGGTKPEMVDSGRTCTSEGLGSFVRHGVKELRFAGATWTTGTQSGLTLATFTSVGGPELQPEWLSEFYRTTAQTAKNVQKLDTSDVTLPSGTAAKRLDVLNDESYQTVVVWDVGDRVAAALIANFIRDIGSKDAHEKVVQAALDALEHSPAGG